MSEPEDESHSAAATSGPAVVLVAPQLGENIGMCARAMWNCGLDDLRLVAPRDGWPNPKANAAAAGGEHVVTQARLFETTELAVADLDYLLATTARPRDMTKDVMTARTAGARLRQASRSGVLFGREAKGLANDDVALADAVVHVPLNPAFPSLNIAQAVLLLAYEWRQAGDDSEPEGLNVPTGTRPANKAEMLGLYEHLERELDACGFLRVAEKRPIMVRNIRNMLGRARLTEQEVRTFRGIVSGLAKYPRRGRDEDGGGEA